MKSLTKKNIGLTNYSITQGVSQQYCPQTKRMPKKLFLLPLAFFLFNTLPARAEGSKELVSQGDIFASRPYLENINFYTATFARQTIIQASVEEGDWINMGSSVIGTGSGDILYTPPGGTATSCNATQPGQGSIDNLDHEANGPGTGTDGSTGFSPTGKYQPCLVQVGAGQGGIWTIEFIPPKQSQPWSKPAAVGATTQWPTPTATDFLIAAWDVTVRTDDNNTVEQTGRVFTELLALNMSGQGKLLTSEFWILTTDGYQYKTSLDQLDPNGFVFLANNKGLLDTDGSPLYHSSTGAKDAETSTALDHGIAIQEPVHKIFFNPPATDLDISIPTTPTAPEVSTLSFTGNIVDNASDVGAGGTFTFNSTIDGSYQIAIRDSSNAIVRVLQDSVVSGSNSVTWDGKDSSGTDLPPGEYTFDITVRAGEYHFPLIDVENNPNGITFELLNAPSAFSAGTDKNTAFYDNTDYTTAAGTAVTLPTTGTPPDPLATDPVVGTGTGSSGYHVFGDNTSTGYGDTKVIDTWIYFNSPSEQSSLVIVDPNVSLDATKQVTLQTDNNNNGQPDPGDVLRYTIALTNSGTGDATGVTFNDTPDANTNLTVGSVTTSTGTVTTGNNTDDTTIEVNIGTIAGSGGTATVTFDVTINDLSAGSSTNITNQGNVTGSNFSSIPTDDPDTTDTADDPTTITVNTPNVTASKTSSLVVDADSNGFASPGDTLEYTITVENSGSASATGVALNDPIPTNTTYVASSLSIDSTDKTDTTSDDEAEFDGTNTVFRLGSGASSTAGGTLAVNASSTVKFKVTIDDGTANGTTISNQGTVTGSNFSDTTTDDPDQDGTSDPNTVTINTDGPNVTASKTSSLVVDADSNGFASPGDTLEYTITVENSGSADATGVALNDPIPTNTTYVAGSLSIDSTDKTDATTDDEAEFDGTNTVFRLGSGASSTTGGTLAVDASSTVKFQVTIDDGTANGTTISNQGTVTGSNFSDTTTDDPDQDGTSDPNTVTINTDAPNITASKTSSLLVDADSNGFASPGDTLEYTITVENDGSADATGVALNDPIPTNTTYVAGSLRIDSTDKTDATSDDEAEFDGTNTVFRLGSGATSTAGGTLAVDASTTVKFHVTIDGSTANGTTISNQGTVTGSNFSDTTTDDPDQDGTSDPNTVTINTTLSPKPSLIIIKRVTAVKRGDVTETLTGFNNDPNDLNDDAFNSFDSLLSGYVQGEFQVTNNIRPGDEVEYTIYFLSNGTTEAQNVQICDFVPANQTFVEDGFNNLPQAPNGFSGTNRGMAIAFGNSSPLSYTNANDGDNSRFISPGSVIPPACLSLNTANSGNGAVLFNLGDLPNFSSNANASFGFVRFRAKVD